VFGVVVGLITCIEDQVGIQVFQVSYIGIPVSPGPFAAARESSNYNFFFLHRISANQPFVHGLFSMPDPVGGVLCAVPVFDAEKGRPPYIVDLF